MAPDKASHKPRLAFSWRHRPVLNGTTGSSKAAVPAKRADHSAVYLDFDASAEELKFIRDHGSDLMSDAEYSIHFENCIKHIREAEAACIEV